MASDRAPVGRRSTRQRLAVLDALAEVDDFRSAQELHEYLRGKGDAVGLTTVYRTLAALAEADEVDVILREDGESIYRRCSGSHHHHLVCRECGRTVEVAGPTVETWAAAVGREHGFTDIRHTVELIGLCRDCSTPATS